MALLPLEPQTALVLDGLDVSGELVALHIKESTAVAGYQKKQVRIFLGKIMFFSSFVPALGEYTSKLFELLTKARPDKWKPEEFGPELVEAVQRVKAACYQKPR